MRELPLVLQLNVAGQPMRWIDYERSAYYSTKGLIAWTMSPIDFTLYGGTNAKTGERSKLTINTIIAIKGTISNKRYSYAPPITNKALFRRDHNMCAYCGGVFSIHTLTRDHIIPTSQGGLNNWTNVVTACGPCNKHKDDYTPEQAKMELLFVPYEPNHNEYLILQNRKILADQMLFLLKGVPKESRLHA